MKSRLLNIAGAEVLSRESQKLIIGQKGRIDLSLCGCSCSGAVIGPDYCIEYMACPDVYTCAEPTS